MSAAWNIVEGGDGIYHAYPINDTMNHVLLDHTLEDGGTTAVTSCWCKPFVRDGVIVHQSLDGREDIER